MHFKKKQFYNYVLVFAYTHNISMLSCAWSSGEQEKPTFNFIFNLSHFVL